MCGVLRRIKRYEVVAERNAVAVLLDQIRDVIAPGFGRDPRPWTTDYVAHRQGLVGVALHGDGLVVSGHHHHAVRRLAPYRAATDRLVIAIGVVDEGLVGEEVEVLGSAHSASIALLHMRRMTKVRLSADLLKARHAASPRPTCVCSWLELGHVSSRRECDLIYFSVQFVGALLFCRKHYQCRNCTPEQIDKYLDTDFHL